MPLRLFKAGLSPVRVRSARYRIELSALTSYLESLHADLPADATVQVQLSCGRFNGDFAHGLITATFDSPFGLLTIASGWEAGTQPRPEHGWYVMPRANAKGEGIEAALPIIDEGEVCEPSGELLSNAAWNFWSYLDLEEHLYRLLPSRGA